MIKYNNELTTFNKELSIVCKNISNNIRTIINPRDYNTLMKIQIDDLNLAAKNIEGRVEHA